MSSAGRSGGLQGKGSSGQIHLLQVHQSGGEHLPKQPIGSLAGRNIRCILFDLGDTLWSRGDVNSWRRLEITSNQRAVNLLRMHVAPQRLPVLNDVLLGQRLREAFNEQARAVILRNPEQEANGPLSVVQTLHQWGIEEVDTALATDIFEALRIRIPESRPLFEDTLSTLAALQQRGFQLGVVTNRLWGGKLFLEDMQRLGLLNYFNPRNIAVSADLGVRKPNSAIFLHTLHALNVAPEHAAMVGDSIRADITGGQRLGILTIWKPKVGIRQQIEAHLIASGVSASSQNLYSHPPQPELSPGVSTPDPAVDDPSAEASLSGMHVTDDDFILSQVSSSDDYLNQYIEGKVRPDLIIGHLRDLLDIFPEVGQS